MKKVILTDHAIDRSRERKIDHVLIKNVVNNPDFTVTRDDAIEAYRQLDTKLLKVVYSEKEKFIIIITAYWVNGDETKYKI